MRTHEEIVKAHGASALFRDLSARGLQLNQTTPQRWADRNSIPWTYWGDLVALEITTVDELVAGAKVRRNTPARQAKGRAA